VHACLCHRYTAGLTWCPEAIQHVVQAAKYRLHKVFPVSSSEMSTTLQTLVHSTGDSKLMLLLDGTLAQVSIRCEGDALNEITVDADDPSPQDCPALWRHTLAVRDGKFFDLYNPRGLHASNLRLTGNVVGGGAYMLKITKVWSVKPPQSKGKRKQWAQWASPPVMKRRSSLPS
jgi:hypothetical protein